jgi:phospholipid/cholesterol/gamma-HCH transport system permease protein
MNDVLNTTRATVRIVPSEQGPVSIVLGGRLDDATLPSVWPGVVEAVMGSSAGPFILDAAQVSYCDGAGLGLFAQVRRLAAGRGSDLSFRGFSPDLQRLVERSALPDPSAPQLTPPARLSFVREVGKSAWQVLSNVRAMVTFLGHLLAALAWAIAHPRQVRFRDLFLVAEKSGVNAAPVVCLLGLLIGVILAFQCAIPMRRYGAQEAIPAVVAIALARELGPLIAAVLFAGRSGSAFTAEIGTMTITEEIAALKCMGLDPVRFLVVPRVLAAMAVLPLLTILCNLTGILGGYSVMTTYGFSFARYVHAVEHAITSVDLLGGEAKTLVFGAIIAGVGCLRGLRTANGPGAVGDSTTRSVVESIVLVILADALFGVIYYYLGI